MNQRALNRAVAKATGETLDRVIRVGFSIIPMPQWIGVRSASTVRLSRKPAPPPPERSLAIRVN